MGIWEGFPPLAATTPHGEPQMLPEVGPAAPPAHRSLLDVRDARSRSRSRRSNSPADDLHGNFHAALTALALRSGDKTSAWKFPAVSSSKNLQRQVALQLCGWTLKEEDLWSNIKRFARSIVGMSYILIRCLGGRRRGITPAPLAGSSSRSSTRKQLKCLCEATVCVSGVGARCAFSVLSD
jgi:hypothetical protein